MKSPSIERFHAKIDKQIRLVESYTELEGLSFIIKICRLKPHDYVFGERETKVSLHRWWFDEFGNSLVINGKQASIIYNDLRLDRKEIIGTDLYYSLTMDRVAKMSELVHLIAGKDDDLHQDCFLLSFLGLDKHLRSYLYLYGEWQQVSPLMMGLNNLEALANSTSLTKHYRQLENKEKCVMPCLSSQAWLSCLPASVDFLTLLDKRYDAVLPIFNHKEHNIE